MQFLILIAFLAAIGGFVWFIGNALDMVNLPLSQWGGTLHSRVERDKPAEEKDAWLFAMLISVTRFPVIIVATLAFTLSLVSYVYSFPLLLDIRDIAFSTFWVLFAMREGGVFIGSVLFGPAMQSILHSLRG